jgi:hypothetical protein
VTSTAREAFERVVDAILCERALPFVGAGVSREAPYDAVGGTATESPSSDLEERLANHLWDLARSSKTTRRFLAGALGRRFRGPQALKRLSLPWLAEQIVQLEGSEHQALCEILDIQRFRNLKPTPAHRYLAFLAREGLLSEVITTNYDECLEKAFRESMPGSGPGECQGGCVHVVTDASRYAERFEKGRPSLTVYKINGSAEEFHGDATSARRIVLAERDLQAWHGDGWAARLFADRVGHKAVILTGFSGEEAQIRFAVAALCNEFGREQQRVAPTEAATRPTAPFVHAYESGLNRFQQQILSVWFGARADEERGKLTPEDRLEFIQSNAFTGEHRTFFREENPGLTADRFWEAVFMSAWRRLLEKEVTSGLTAGFLTGLGIEVSEIARGICQALFDGGSRRCYHSELLEVGRRGSRSQRPFSFMHCLGAVRTSDMQPGTYVALREEPLLFSTLLLFLAWCYRFDGVEASENLGLRLPRENPETTLESWIAASPFLPGASGSAFTDTRQLAFIQIALFMKGPQYLAPDAETEEIRESCRSSDGSSFERHGIRVDARLLLKRAAEKLINRKGQSDWTDFCEVVNEMVDNPWDWLQDHRPSFRDRTTEC